MRGLCKGAWVAGRAGSSKGSGSLQGGSQPSRSGPSEAVQEEAVTINQKKLADAAKAPERIWLLLHEGEGGSHVWCDQPDPSGHGEHDAVEYVRTDLVKAALVPLAIWAHDEDQEP